MSPALSSFSGDAGVVTKEITNEDGTKSETTKQETIEDLLLEDGLWMDNNAMGIQLRGKDPVNSAKMFSAMSQYESLFNLFWMPSKPAVAGGGGGEQ